MGGIHHRYPVCELALSWKLREVHVREGLVHGSLGDAYRARCSARKELKRDVAVGYGVRKARYETVVFLTGEAGYNMEEVPGDGIFLAAQAGFRPSIVLQSSGRSYTGTHTSLADLFMLLLDTF